MMYLDHSAIVAVLLKGDGWSDVARRIDDHRGKLIISPISYCQTVRCIAGDNPTPDTIGKASEIVSDFLKEASVQTVTISTAQTRAAIEIQQDHLEQPGAAVLALDEMMILGVAKSFRSGVLATGGRFAGT